MRRTIVSLCALCCMLTIALESAHADPHDLTGGALIAHYNPGYWSYRYPTMPCELYFQVDPLTQCEDQNNMIAVSSYLPVVWYVVAAFEEDKEWCGVQFGLSDYPPNIMLFTEGGPCFPNDGLEIPSLNWPGPNEGTAFVVTNDPWQGNFLPVYYFIGYAYSYYGSGVMQLVPDPSVSNPFGGFANCLSPGQLFDAALGGMGINEQGTYVCWSQVDYVCCVGQDCVLVQSEDECTLQGGVFHPEWHDCGPPNPCIPTPTTPSTWGVIKNLYR